jgi:pyruvate kinase
MTRRTKVVATVGPATSSPERVAELIEAGLDVARLNLAHGEPAEHRQAIQRVRTAAASASRTVGVLIDLPGPKVRTTPLAGPTTWETGSRVQVVAGDEPTTNTVVAVHMQASGLRLRAGDAITLGDGVVRLVVEEPGPPAMGEVVRGGSLRGRPGVHLPAGCLTVTAPTDRDLEHLAASLTEGIDFVALSFVRSADDIGRLRDALPADGPVVVAKIETAEAVDDLDRILAATDAVMVARGDLGAECPLEDVPHLQKAIIRAAVHAGCPVITATQMLESMTEAPFPTRAEASDVANAVLDGTDAVMLSGETAVGRWPVEAVRTIATIAERAERELLQQGWIEPLSEVARPGNLRAGATHAVWRAARDADIAAVVCRAADRELVRSLAALRPHAPVYAIGDETDLRRLAICWGVVAVVGGRSESLLDSLRATSATAALQPGDAVAVVAEERASWRIDLVHLPVD